MALPRGFFEKPRWEIGYARSVRPFKFTKFFLPSSWNFFSYATFLNRTLVPTILLARRTCWSKTRDCSFDPSTGLFVEQYFSKPVESKHLSSLIGFRPPDCNWCQTGVRQWKVRVELPLGKATPNFILNFHFGFFLPQKWVSGTSDASGIFPSEALALKKEGRWGRKKSQNSYFTFGAPSGGKDKKEIFCVARGGSNRALGK